MPTLLLTFANNDVNRLYTLTKEYNEINNVLRNRQAQKDFEVISEPLATRESIIENIRAHEEDLAVFLFSGHAGRDKLLFEDGKANAEGVAEMLGRCKNLKLVILNGCSTSEQVQALLRNSIPAIIATSAPINDEKATRFSIAFFKELSQQKQSISDAFERAIASTKVSGHIERVEVTRGLGIEKENNEAVWGLYYNDLSSLSWHLPQKNTDSMENKISPLGWGGIAAIAFAMFITATFLFVKYHEKINFISPTAHFYLLIPLALVPIGFLFGALRSYAKYTGKVMNGTLQLGGPAVLYLIILWLGMKSKPDEKSVSFSVNVFSEKDSTEAILSGEVKLMYGQATYIKKISEGQCTFSEIPSEYKGKTLTLTTRADGFLSKKQPITIIHESETLNLYLQKIPDEVTVKGLVTNRQGQPVKNAILVFADGIAKDTSDTFGNFRLALPFKDGTETTLRVYTGSKLRFNNLVTLSATIPLTVQL